MRFAALGHPQTGAASHIFYGDLKYQLIKQQKAYVLLNFFSKYSSMAVYCSQFA